MFQNFMPTPIMNAYQSPMQMYGHGGHIHHHYPYHHQAEMLQHFGTGHDRILAHINPAEASYLQHHHGMSVNPHTGLPQFGFYDTLKSGLGSLGRAAVAAAPSIWEYARPLAQQGLSALDTRIQGALPELAQNLGTRFGGERGGQIGASLGQGLANQFGKAGGLSGQLLPRVDTRLGFQGETAPGINPRQMATEIGQGLWKDVGRGMVRGGLQNIDERVMGALPGMGSRIGGAIGGKFGMGERGAQFGSQIGSNLSGMYGETPGISGYATPRLNQAVQNFGMPNIPPAPPPPPMTNYRPTGPGPQAAIQAMGQRYAHGGHLHYHPHYMHGGY